MSQTLHRLTTLLGVAAILLAVPALAVEPTESDSASALNYFEHSDLYIRHQNEAVSALGAIEQAALASRLQSLGIDADYAFLDRRGGTFTTLIQSRPMVPGNGVNNALTWEQFGLSNPSMAEMEAAVAAAFESYLDNNAAALGIDTAELGEARVSIKENGRVTHISMPREINGVAVDNSMVLGAINSGNLVLFGALNWGPADVSTTPTLSESAAKSALEGHIGQAPMAYSTSRLVMVPTSGGQALHEVATIGAGYEYRLAWELRPAFERGEDPTWAGLVDAHDGTVLRFRDENAYLSRNTVGAIMPVSNDGASPDGIEAGGFPMPFMNVVVDGVGTVTSPNGLIPNQLGAISGQLRGPFVLMNDNCGGISQTQTSICENLDFGATNLGAGGQGDCGTPPGASPGNTRSSRSGFYEVNRIIETAKIFRPTNPWLNSQLQANMNINNNCNAFWNGTINFYTSGGGCGNTGEIAAVFDHEWGHGLDANDNIPAVSVPGEAYADIAAIYRLSTSCIGRGFFLGGTCGGNGDPCTVCSGVREDDWKFRASGLPHDTVWIQQTSVSPGIPGVVAPGGCADAPPTNGAGPCGSNTHCEGTILGESFWDLLTRDLPCLGTGWEDVPGTVGGGQCIGGAATTMPSDSALEIATRLYYLAGDGVALGFTCNAGPAGCGASGWYLNLLTADDDNGDLTDGTPNMTAIYGAFARHSTQCEAPLPVNSGCTNRPTGSPTVTLTPLVEGMQVDWTSVADADKYQIYRTEGVFACGFGKLLIGEVDAADPLTFTDNGLLDGFDYSYMVLPIGVGADSCAGIASACQTAQALPATVTGPGLAVLPVADPLTLSGDGDGDIFLDNCETATADFSVVNIGDVPLTNVTVTSITPVAPAGHSIVVTTPTPFALGALTAGCGTATQSAVGSFDFIAGGLSQNDTLSFQVTATADELSGGTVTTTIHVGGDVEQDLALVPTRTYSFEGGMDGWTNPGGTWVRTTADGGGAGGPASFYMASSTAVDFACDRLQSPPLRLTATSTLTLQNQFVTEPEGTGGGPGTFYDRGNVYLVDPISGTRINPINPDGGRTYNASTAAGNTYAGCNEPDLGWATGSAHPDATTWAPSSWSPSALGGAGVVGSEVFIEVINATDSTASARGLWVDEITVTDILDAGPDAQPDDSCVAPPTCTVATALFADDFNTGNTSAWSIVRNPQGDLSVLDVGLEGGFGLRVGIDKTGGANQLDHYVAATHADTGTYCWSFLFDPNTISLPPGKFIRIWGARGSDNRRLLTMAIRNIGGTYHVALQAYKDGFAAEAVPFTPIADGPVLLGGEWSNTANGGVLKMFVDGVEAPGSKSGISPMTRDLRTPGMGNLGQLANGTLGALFFDAFVGGSVAP